MGDATGAIGPEDNDNINSSNAQDQAGILAEGNDTLANDPSIALGWWDSLSQSFLQATGQLNSDGTGPGGGFWTSAIGLCLIGGGVLVGAYFLLESPVLAAVLSPKKNPVRRKRKRTRHRRM
jgi:hypothetical protein